MAANNHTTATSIAQVRRSQRLFKPVDEAPALLQLVLNADYDAMRQIWDRKPELMFSYVASTNANGKPISISPLQKAFEQYDTYTWKGFLNKIKDDPALVEKFYAQAEEQPTHINLRPLFNDYEAQGTRHGQWVNGLISERKVNLTWKKLVATQHQLLPIHLLREFCRPGLTWVTASMYDLVPRSTFDVDCLPPPPDSPVIRQFNSAAGQHLGILRGHGDSKAGCEKGDRWNWEGYLASSGDCAVLKLLFKIRRKDLETQLASKPTLSASV